MNHIHLGFHFYGAGNIGDDLMISGFLNVPALSANRPRLTCCTPFDIESQRIRFPEIEWFPYDDATRRELIKTCDVWLGLGDTPFQTDCGGWFFDHLKFEFAAIEEYGKPAYMLCVGVNNHAAAENPETAAILDRLRHTWTRDLASADALAKVAGWFRIHPAADLAHLVDYPPQASHRHPDGEPLILVIHSEDETHIDINALDAAILAHPGPVYWYCQEVREFGANERATYAKLAENTRAKLKFILPDYHRAPLADLIGLFQQGGVCLTCRYHSAILSAWMGLRVAVFARNAKLDGAIGQLGLARAASLRDIADIQAAIADARPVDRIRLHGLKISAQSACDSFFAMISTTR